MSAQNDQARERVLVGVDGSDAARKALAFAVQEAKRRGATLVAVTAVDLPDFAWIDPYLLRNHPESEYLARTREKLHTMLVEQIGPADVPVEPVVEVAAPAEALISRSADADLLVVGSRGRGGFRGLLMGSVSLQCVLHAHCPVTVVRPEPVESQHSTDPATAARRPPHTLDDARRETIATFL